jgi:hypothetical protein
VQTVGAAGIFIGGVSAYMDGSAEAWGWVAFDAATMRAGPLLHNTVLEGLDHAAGVASWGIQTGELANTCQVPLRC